MEENNGIPDARASTGGAEDMGTRTIPLASGVMIDAKRPRHTGEELVKGLTHGAAVQN